MKSRILSIVVVFFLAQSFVTAQQKTPFGDEVGTLDGIIKAYYETVTVKKGEKISFVRDSFLHAPNALVGMARKDKSGKLQLQLITLKEFHKNSDAMLEKDGFYEKEISRKVENYGSIYHVWSTYEARNVADGPLLERGINSIQLFFDGARFWILSWVFDNEGNGNPIPKKYLIN